jgi:hypothetical protein
MNSQNYQLIINSFSVGTWLQTLVFYSFLIFMFNIIITQLKLSSSKLEVDMIGKDDEEAV